MMISKFMISDLLCLFATQMACGQAARDTVAISLQTFIKRGLKHSGKMDADRQEVKLANNRIRQAQSKRYLPKLTLDTKHGVVPGVKSDKKDLSPNEYYLDPDLKNNWRNYSIGSHIHLEAIQPIFTWGALRNAVKASRAAAEAAQKKFEITKQESKLRLYKLYQSYLLSLEVQRLLKKAQHTIKQVDKKLNEEKKNGNSALNEADLFKFKIFKSEFGIQAAKVKKNAKFVQRVWNYVLRAGDSTVYIPKERFLDPVQNALKPIGYYKSRAINSRPEIKALDAGIRAANYGVNAMKARYYPKFFVGITGSFAYTPNRPRQSNPFIINKTNYASAAVGIGIHQNLDIFALHYDVKRSKIKRQQVKDSKAAAIDGIVLQVNKKYKNASLSKIKIEQNHEALVTAERWVRQEELEADLNRGDPKNLIDSIKKELELKVSYEQAIFSFNEDIAELYRTAALPVTSLKMGFTE